MASCPNTTGTLYDSHSFLLSTGTMATFYAFTKHLLTGDSWSFKILDSMSRVVDSWNYTSLSNRNTGTLGWNRTLPSVPGIYTIEGTFLGQNCSTTFEIAIPTYLGQLTEPIECMVYPNPSNGHFTVSWISESARNASYRLALINMLGTEVYSCTLESSLTEISPDVPAGVYHYMVRENGVVTGYGKIVIK